MMPELLDSESVDPGSSSEDADTISNNSVLASSLYIFSERKTNIIN